MCATMPKLPRVLFYSLAALAAVAAVTSLGYPRTGNDSPLFALAGQAILEGGVPYRDVWDVKGPGVYLINALALLLVGKSALGARIFDFAWQLLTAWLAGAIAFRIYRRESVRFVVLFAYLIYYYSQNFWSWLQSDSYSSLPLAAGFLGMLMGMEKDRPPPWTLAGAGIGFATLLKIPLGALGVAMMLAACLAGGFVVARAARRLAWLAVGFLAPLLACGLYLYGGGALDDYFEAQLRYAPQYIQIVREQIRWHCLSDGLTRPVLLPVYAGILLAVVGLFVRWRDGGRLGAAEVSLMLWAALVYVVVWVQSVFFLYHYLPMVIPVATLAAGTMVPLYQERRGRSLVWRFAVLVFLLAMCVVPVKKIGEHTLQSLRTLRSGYEHDVWADAARYLQERTEPHDRIHVWGNAASIYWNADRKPASRFVSVFPFSPQLHGLSYRDTLFTELQASRPVYILVVKSVPHSFDCTYPIDEEAFLASFPALEQWIQSEYFLERDQHQRAPRYWLYRRKSP